MADAAMGAICFMAFCAAVYGTYKLFDLEHRAWGWLCALILVFIALTYVFFVLNQAFAAINAEWQRLTNG